MEPNPPINIKSTPPPAILPSPKQPSKGLFLFLLIPLGIMLLYIYTFSVQFVRSYNQLQAIHLATAKTTASVINTYDTLAGKNNLNTHTVIRYTVNGKSFEADLENTLALYKTGQNIPIIYDPQKPTIVYPADNPDFGPRQGMIGLPTMLIGLTLFTAFILWISRKKKTPISQMPTQASSAPSEPPSQDQQSQ